MPAITGVLLAGGIVSAGALTALPADLSLSIPANSGEQNPLPLGTGVDGYYDVELRNLGPHNATGVTLTVTLPAGLELGSNKVMLYTDEAAAIDGTGSTLACNGVTNTVTCTVTPVDLRGNTTNPQILEVDVLASTGATSGSTVGEPGTSANFSVAITSDGDTNTANNSLSATIDFTGIADLTYSISPAAPKVGVGRSTIVTLTVHNNGPQVAGNAIGIALAQPDGHFSISGFQVTTPPPPAATARRLAARQSVLKHLARTATSPAARTAAAQALTSGATPTDTQLWLIGDIASGATATANLTLTANTAGSSQLALIAASEAADTGCVNQNDPCTPGLATLTANPQTSTAYIASSRVGAAVYINALVKQATPAGIIRSAGRTVYLQRYLNGAWQSVLTRTTDKAGQFTVGFVQAHPQTYRLYIVASTTASTAHSSTTTR